MSLPRAIDLMKKREEQILETISHISKKTDSFKKPKLMLIGGYALRAFIKFSRYTRDCDFIVKKKDGWHLDDLSKILPKDWRVKDLEKRDQYGFMRCIKFTKYDETRIKVSIDFMEGEIRGRKKKERISIDEKMIQNSEPVSIPIADERVEVLIPDYTDYFIMKVISYRASDIRDIASLVHENGIPSDLKKRAREILPYPEVFSSNIQQRVIPEIKRRTFIDSWKGIMATTEFTGEDKEKVLKKLEEFL